MAFLQVNPESIHALQLMASDYKFWAAVVAFVVAGYKAYEWVKQIRTKDVPEIHTEIKKLSATMNALGDKLDAQTVSVVGELKEMRADFRTFYISPSPQMMPVQSRPRVAKPRKKKPAAKAVAVPIQTVSE